MRKTAVIISIFAFIVGGCGQKEMKTTSDTQVFQDTIVVKHKNVLNNPHDIYSKSYFYYWLVGKDTLDFMLYATEYKDDSTFHLNVFHNNPILFAIVLERIKECLPLIKEDFDVSKFSSIYFKEPIYYLDLAKKLSSEYEQEFGQKNISYEKLNQFLLKSSLNLQLESFLSPLNKKVKRYGIEKFHLMEKEHYEMHFYYKRVSDIDFTEYPEFTLCGIGVSIQLENQ